MTQFHEGQNVEVADPNTDFGVWLKAKIVREPTTTALDKHPLYQVEFPDGKRAVFDAEHIRAVHCCVSSNDPMGTRAMTKDEVLDFRADLARSHDEALEAEGKP